MTEPSIQVSRVMARDDLLHLAADADEAVGIVRQRESLARRAEDEPDVFGLALRHYLSETRSNRWAIRAQAWSYAATIVCFCDLVDIAVESPYQAEEMYARAAQELAENVVDGPHRDQDLTLGVFNTYRRARSLRLYHRYDEALRLVVVPVTDLFGTGAEPHWADYLYEQGACLIANGQAAQVQSALGEQRRYWAQTRAAGFSSRHRFDFVLALAEWEQGRVAQAERGLRAAVGQVVTDGQPPDRPVDLTRASLDEALGVRRLSMTLGLAECLVAGGRTVGDLAEAAGDLPEERLREVLALGERALKIAERIRGRWRVIARSRAPLAVAFRRIYGDIALLASTLSGTAAAELGFRVALSAKQTGFASRVREGRLLMSPHISGLLEEIVNVEDPPTESLTAGDEASRDEKLRHLRFRVEEAVSPMLADTVLPVPTDLARLTDVIGSRYALDFVALPDTLGRDRKNWFRSTIRPGQPISFERFVPGPAYAGFFEGRDGERAWLGRLAQARGPAGPDWRGLAFEVLPTTLLAELRRRTTADPIELLISAHSALSLLPWAALRIDDEGTPLVERAVIAQCPALTCLTYPEAPTVAGPALVRLVAGEAGVNVIQERDAWKLPERQGEVPLSRCEVGPDSSPVEVDGDLPAALHDETAGWQFVHIASHGGGEGLGQFLLLPRRLLAAQALGMRWPASVLMASCHVGRLVNPEDAEPLSFVMALLTGGSRCVVAGIDYIPDLRTGRAAAQIVDAVRQGPVRLDVALRKVQLAAVGQRDPRWALLNAYVR